MTKRRFWYISYIGYTTFKTISSKILTIPEISLCNIFKSWLSATDPLKAIPINECMAGIWLLPLFIKAR